MMKQYVASNHLRLIGKGWEIRHQLAKLAARSDSQLLTRFTTEHPPIWLKLGSSGSGAGSTSSCVTCDY